jgi:4-amino-4-deoxy-L-arabinose transferase
MPNPYIIKGIIVLLLCAAGYWYAYKQEQRQRYTLALAMLMLCGMAVRVYCSMDSYLHPWDERYHALVAKNLMLHWLKPTLYENPILPYNITSWSSNHVWLHKQPLSLWLIALSLKTFGVSAFAVRIPSILLSTIAIKLVYDIALQFYGRRTAFLSALLLSTNGLIIELASGRVATDHPDITFFFFVLLGVDGCKMA